MPGKENIKVLKLHILKPANDMTWSELGKILGDTRYRVYRLANLAVSEAYLDYHLYRKGKKADFETRKISALNKELFKMLRDEAEKKNKVDFEKWMQESKRYSRDQKSALPSAITDALSYYKIKGLTGKTKWSEVIRGKASLPNFKLNMAIPIICHKSSNPRLERMDNGDVEVDLAIRIKPYPRVVIATGDRSLGPSQKEILERLLNNKSNKIEDGYSQRLFEIKEDPVKRKWFLLVTYSFKQSAIKTRKDIVVGVDLGFSCPLYAAVNNGHARIGWKAVGHLGKRIRHLQSQTISRRREIQRGGNIIASKESARSGHGRKRKLKPIEKLEGRIDRAYSTINHQLSMAVVNFAKNHGAGTIQMERLDGLSDELKGTFLGERWRRHDLQKFIEYKAGENGIEVIKIDPQYTSRRCSRCGHINEDFSFEYRMQNSRPGKPTKFKCKECGYSENADYNAAKNISTLDIENKIRLQLKKQGINKSVH